jgi:hypothetical protein
VVRIKRAHPQSFLRNRNTVEGHLNLELLPKLTRATQQILETGVLPDSRQ